MEKQVDRISIGMEKSYRGWDVPAYLYDGTGKLLKCAPEKAVPLPQETVEELCRRARGRDTPYLEEFQGEIYMTFAVEEGEVLLGPVYIFGLDLPRPKRPVVILVQERAMTCLSTVYFLITGNYVSEEELMENGRCVTSFQETHTVSQFLEFSEEDAERLEYDYEKEWTDRISRGELPSLEYDAQRVKDTIYNVGVLTKQGELKQTEYMEVSGIVLASRAAIRGGVDPHKAYELSDLYLQKISEAVSMEDMLRIGTEATLAFTELVRKRLRSIGGNPYCEQVKNYIGRHLWEKIHSSDIAGHVGLNSTYLTHLFSREEGMTIKAYIIRERLKLAANLLKNTSEPVSAISDYLSFNSSSYFTSCFRKEYGMVPTEYRNKYKLFSDRWEEARNDSRESDGLQRKMTENKGK